MIRSIGVLGVLCLAVVPSFGDPVEYTFDVISQDSYIGLTIQDCGSTIMSTTGLLTVSIYQSDGHIESSDTLLLTDLDIDNTETGKVGVGLFWTANIDIGDLWLLEFIEDANYPAHIGEGGTFTADAGVVGVVILRVTGYSSTTLVAYVSSGWLSGVDGAITTSGETSDTIAMTLDFWVTSIPVEWTLAVTTTLWIDLDVHLEATAHQTPDPALGGLIALGLGGAGTWLRRRRRV